MGKGKRQKKKNTLHRRRTAKVRKEWKTVLPYGFRDWLFSYGNVYLWVPIIFLYSVGWLKWMYADDSRYTVISVVSWTLGFGLSFLRSRVHKKLDDIFRRPPSPARVPQIRKLFVRLFKLQWLVLLCVGMPVLMAFGWTEYFLTRLGVRISTVADWILVVLYWGVSAVVSGVLGNWVYDLLKGKLLEPR